MWYDGRERVLGDFVRFGRALIRSGDIDPQFPILRRLYDWLGLSTSDALWHSAVYLVYYHLGSATVAWEQYGETELIQGRRWRTDLPYTKQRRCFRGNDGGRRQLNALLEASNGDLAKWTERLVGDGGEEGWARVRAAVSELPFHGPWSSYKWCDMLKFVHGYPITAPDIGTKPGATAGPIAGLTSLTGLGWRRCAEDGKLHRELLSYVQGEGVPANGLDHLESILCDWQSLVNGRYYLGHDIDRDLGQLSTFKNARAQIIIDLREQLFDHRLLGEMGEAWSGIRLPLNFVYRDRRRLVNDFLGVRVVKL